jgi:hypothetical protein
LVNKGFTIVPRDGLHHAKLARQLNTRIAFCWSDLSMNVLPYVSDRASAALATDLMADFGKSAGREAKARANQSRDIGNIVHFCRWRQIERLIGLLEVGPETSTRH